MNLDHLIKIKFDLDLVQILVNLKSFRNIKVLWYIQLLEKNLFKKWKRKSVTNKFKMEHYKIKLEILSLIGLINI